MDENLLKLLFNYGFPALYIAFLTHWALKSGVPMINNWVLKGIEAIGNKYDKLADKDTTLDVTLQGLMREFAVITSELRLIRQEIQKIQVKQEWEEKKIIQLLNNQGLNKRQDDQPIIKD